MPSPSPAGASSLLHSTDKPGNNAWRQREHYVRGGRVPHALRQVDAKFGRLDAGGRDASW